MCGLGARHLHAPLPHIDGGSLAGTAMWRKKEWAPLVLRINLTSL